MTRYLLFSLIFLTGCSFTAGPKVESNIVFVKHKGIAARVSQNIKVPLVIEKDGQVYKSEQDIGGFYVISPDVKEEQEKPK